jgi:predicted nuclease of predicted toxin-antitoxin system
VRFLLDENLSPRLKVALLRLNPTVDVVRVGDPDAPSLGTRDPDVLRYLETSQRLLVTSNRTSMSDHIEAHWAVGGHLWGLLWVRPGTPVGRLAQDLLLVWEASEAEEWIDQLDWIPF